MLGDRKKGVYDVTIQEAKLKDAGKYECQTTFIKDGETVPIRSQSAPIDVLGKILKILLFVIDVFSYYQIIKIDFITFFFIIHWFKLFGNFYLL